MTSDNLRVYSQFKPILFVLSGIAHLLKSPVLHLLWSTTSSRLRQSLESVFFCLLYLGWVFLIYSPNTCTVKECTFLMIVQFHFYSLFVLFSECYENGVRHPSPLACAGSEAASVVVNAVLIASQLQHRPRIVSFHPPMRRARGWADRKYRFPSHRCNLTRTAIEPSLPTLLAHA